MSEALEPAPRSEIARYFQWRLWVILLLGFSSGLPLALVGGTLAARLTDSGIAMADIGLFAYVALPYSYKFLWAPLVDRLPLPGLTQLLGRRRGWMVASQIAVAVCLALLAFTDPASAPEQVAVMALLVAFFSATQDIVIDAYRTEYLRKDQYGEGAPMAVLGYRIGMLAAGAGALYLADFIDWRIAYLTMAGLMGVGMVTTLMAGEPAASGRVDDATPKLKELVVAPFKDFMRTHRAWLVLLLFVLCYRLPDGFIGFMTTPFLQTIGFTKTAIASVGKLFGFGATLLGMFIGGAVLAKRGVYVGLLAFGLFQIVANLAYILVAFVGPDMRALALAIAMDNLSGGMVSAAAIAFMMRLCQSAEHTATQYALLSSLAAFGSVNLAGQAGWIAETYGWATMFGLSAVLGLPALAVLLLRPDIIKDSIAGR